MSRRPLPVDDRDARADTSKAATPAAKAQDARRAETRETLKALHELLRAASGDQPVDRSSAPKYALFREELFRSHLASALPGFLSQCGSLGRFQDFIRLYHGRLDARIRFVDAGFERAWVQLQQAESQRR
jgi:hypothetical protein